MHDPTEGGLATALHELSTAASVGMLVEMEKIFVFPETDFFCKKLRLDPLGVLASGALLIVAKAGEGEKIRSALEKERIFSAVIGRVWEKEKGVKLLKEGKLLDLPRFTRDELARLFERGKSEPDSNKVPE
jgi:hydrogenase maturation factor